MDKLDKDKIADEFRVGIGNSSCHHFYPVMKEAAVRMRRNPTPAEEKIWYCLSGGKLGWKFRRQHVIGSFIVDFYCVEKALVIEIDGGIHDRQVEKDHNREKCLTDLGCRIIRFSNDQALSQTKSVIKAIKAELTRPNR